MYTIHVVYSLFGGKIKYTNALPQYTNSIQFTEKLRSIANLQCSIRYHSGGIELLIHWCQEKSHNSQLISQKLRAKKLFTQNPGYVCWHTASIPRLCSDLMCNTTQECCYRKVCQHVASCRPHFNSSVIIAPTQLIHNSSPKTWPEIGQSNSWHYHDVLHQQKAHAPIYFVAMAIEPGLDTASQLT